MEDATPTTNNKATLLGAVLGAIGASLCCVAPLVLVSLGIGGAWISYLTALEPYRPIFIGITLLFLGLAFRKLYLVPQKCAPGDVCALPATRRNQRIIFWIATVSLLALLAFPYYGQVFFE
ncbi:mercuric transporter MerT family protein [Thiolapillus brandeum]|uniref:Mercuric transport protein MerT n=1 Tax=Thiolapillus brandeum TaxID=1076588 RepID=A0A7U6GJT7_9GAMM|nr:mercuric transporter MerT family protein [Thiolapillus brandeum]BAO44899.1 mercuric ion transport protein [Thiolapillus brandeum]